MAFIMKWAFLGVGGGLEILFATDIWGLNRLALYLLAHNTK